MAYKLSAFRDKYGIPDCIILCDKNSKRPLSTDWVNSRPHLTPEQLDSPSHNKGLVLLDKFAVLDVDDYAKAEKFFTLHGYDLAEIKNDPELFVYGNTGPSSAGKGKFKVLFRLPDGMRMPKFSFSTEHGVEFRSGECQDILPGSIHPDGGEYTVFNEPYELPELDGPVLRIWHRLWDARCRERTLQGQTEQRQFNRIPDKQMVRMLTYLPPDWVEDYEQWWKVGAALQRAEYPYELWAEWSSQSAKWDANAALRKWNTSFGGDNARAPFTIASIISAARNNGYSDSDISDLFGTRNTRSPGKAFFSEEETAAGVGPVLTDEDLLPPDDQFTAVRRDGYEMLRNEFVYLTEPATFYHIPTGGEYTSRTLGPGFADTVLDVPDLKNPGSFVKFSFGPVLKSPGDFMPKALRLGFEPGAGLIVSLVDEDGVPSTVLNLCRYDASKIPVAPPSADTKRILDGLFDHFTEGGTNTECVSVLTHMMQSLHYKMVNPGARFNYAHLLISQKGGTGKSFFSDVLPSTVFGSYAVKITNAELESDFTEYKQKALIVTVEELKIGGSAYDKQDMRETNRFLNKLKDWMTAAKTQVNIKGKSRYAVRNCVAIFATSNHIDCIPPASEEDRRWLACTSRAGNIHDISPELSADCYALFADKTKHAEIRGWVMSFSIAKINPHKLPFYTETIAQMADTAESPLAEALADLYGPTRDPSLPDIVTRDKLVADIREHLGDPNIRWGRSIKVALQELAGAERIVWKSYSVRLALRGNNIVQAPTTTRTPVVILRNAAKYKDMPPTDIVKLALQATTSSNRLSIV